MAKQVPMHNDVIKKRHIKITNGESRIVRWHEEMQKEATEEGKSKKQQ